VHGPASSGCIGEGETADEALENIREAIELYLEPADDDLADIEGAEVHESVGTRDRQPGENGR